MKTPRRAKKAEAGSYLDGQMLIAMPSMSDPRFARSVIFMCAHSAEGAMGLIVNQRADNITFRELLEQIGLLKGKSGLKLAASAPNLSVHVGGPVETGRGFVLHSDDYFAEDASLRIGGRVCLTTTLDILKAIAAGKGPEKVLLALGYAGWAPGQLESEIQANGWLHCASDAELVFGPDVDAKYEKAMTKIGIDPSHLVSTAGHA